MTRISKPSWDFFFYLSLGAYLVYLLWRTAHLPLAEWDEARNVMHAYEMMKRGDWIASTYNGDLDLYYLKPPFLKWLLALLFKCFGYSELAARIPSIGFGLGTGILVFHFLKSLGTRPWIAAACALALVTGTGFYGSHVMTSADVDATVCFFDTLSFIAICRVFVEQKPRWYYALGLSIALGFLTKSVVGLLPLAAIGLVLFDAKSRTVLRSPHLWGGLGLAALLALPWLAARDLLYPDHYLRQLIGYDVLARSATVLDAHKADAWFYLRRMQRDMGPWFYVVCFSALILADRAVRRIRNGNASRDTAWRAGILAAALGLAYLLAFSMAQTKIRWYILPAYPLFFIAAGIGLNDAAKLCSPRLLQLILSGLLALNVWAIRRYEAARWTGVVLVDYILFPFKSLVWHQPIIVQGELNQNAFVTARIYSDLRETIFPEKDAALDRMLENAPAAEFLASTEAQRYADDPRLETVALVSQSGREGKFGLFKIKRRPVTAQR